MNEKDATFLKIEHYSDHPEVRTAAEILVNGYARNMQFIKGRDSWIKAARKLIASLWVRDEDMFRFSTRKDYFSRGNRKQVWLTPKTLKLFKTMESLDWVTKEIAAVPPKYSKKHSGGLAAVYSRTTRFKELLSAIAIQDIELDDDLPLVTLTDDEGNYKELTNGYLSTESYSNTVDILNRHYQLLRDSDVRDSKGTLLTLERLRYRRRFKGRVGIGGRFYSPFCNESKRERLSVTMQGKPVGSLDFSQLHPTLILLLTYGVGEEPNLFATGDVYDMPNYPGLPRQAHKKFINTIFNASSVDSAARSISTATEYWDIFDDCPVFKTYKGKEKRIGNPVWLNPKVANARKYVDEFLYRHPSFEQAIASGRWGTYQLIDSSILESVISKATNAGIPVLPVHDEVIVPVEHRNEVHDMMVSAFHELTQHKFSEHQPKIKWEIQPN